MAKYVRISDGLYALAQAEAALQERSIAQQLEHWAKRGLAIEETQRDHISALEIALTMTRKFDALDIATGKRRPDATHLISRSVARASKPKFPGVYKKSDC